MSVELIPSITATNARQLRRLAGLAQSLAPTVHLDIMDGRFVPTKSVSARQLADLKWKRAVEIHAMVNDATALLPLLDIFKPRRVYLQVERGSALLPFIAVLRSRKIECGLAVKPNTPLATLKPFVRYAKSILLLAVQPGRYHAPLQPRIFFRIKKVHRLWPRQTIVVDGSMNIKTVIRAIYNGARRIIVGSAVMLSDDPQASWQALRQLTK